MPTIILASTQVDQWQRFSDTLQADTGADVVKARSAAEALDAAQALNPLAVVIDAELGDMPGVELVRRLLAVNATINTALVSIKSDDVFHSETEGLGILMKLSPIPTSAEAGCFARCLRQVIGAV